MDSPDRKKILIIIIIAFMVLAVFYSLKDKRISLRNEFWNYTYKEGTYICNVQFTLINKKVEAEQVIIEVTIYKKSENNDDKTIIEQHSLDFKLSPKSVQNIKKEYLLKDEPGSVFVKLLIY